MGPNMLNQSLKDRIVGHLLPRVQMPGQYVGGELNSRRVPLLAGPAVKGALTPDATALLDKPAVAPAKPQAADHGSLSFAIANRSAMGGWP